MQYDPGPPAIPALIGPKKRFDSLQVFRGLAALAVVCFHLGVVSSSKIHAPFLGDAFRHGNLGVPFFFVLSGFIICFIHRRDIGHPETAQRFLFKRFWRVYPLAFLVTGVHCLLALVMGPGASSTPLTLSSAVSSLLLLPQARLPLVNVTWTLSHEVFFYAIFLLVILLGTRGGLTLLLSWAGAIIVLNLPGMPALDWLPGYLFNPYGLQFLTGCVVACLFTTRTYSLQVAWTMILTGCAMVVGGYFLYEHILAWPIVPERLFWALAFGLIVLGSTTAENHLQRSFPQSLRVLGDASYSIYLVHLNVQTILAVLFLKLGLTAHWNVQVLLMLIGALSVLAGLLVWRFVEKPLLAMMMNRPQSGRAALPGKSVPANSAQPSPIPQYPHSIAAAVRQ